MTASANASVSCNIKPWIFEFFTVHDTAGDSRPEHERWADAYSWYLKLWVQAENIGFEGIFFSEHHFMPGRLSPSPNLLIAAVAARTSRLRLGAMGMVVPLYEPWRLAEEIAMLDMLSQGRLEIGLSSGTGPMEYKAVGLPSDEIRPRFTEALEVVNAALTQVRFSHQGRFWKLDNIAISPRPVQQPMPPRWITALSASTAATAAQGGYKVCTAFIATEAVMQLFTAYREAAAQAGRTASANDLGIRRMIFVTDDDSEGREIARAAVQRWRKLMSSPPPGNAHALPKGVVPDAPQAPKGAHGQNIGDDEAIGGSPANVAEQIIEQCRATGAGHMLGYTFGSFTRAQVERNYELWREVIPVLRKANIS